MTRLASVLSRFETREIPGGIVDYARFNSPGEVLNWVNSNPQAVKACVDITSNGENWTGLGGQSLRDVLRTGTGNRALEAFTSAQAKLEAAPIIGGRPLPALAGGAWVIPAVLAGNPMCARMKPRTKLPHKDIRFTLQVSAFVDQSELSEVCAKIARAVWDYILAGGTATLTGFYIYGYSTRGPEKQEAACFEVNIPLSSSAGIALALSTVFYRPICMGLASFAMSPDHGDCIPMARHLKPHGAIPLQGLRGTDFPTLQKAGIV